MLLRTTCLLATTALVLAACDDTSSPTSPTGSADSTLRHPAALVGSWVAPAGDFAMAHMVLRSDATGATVGVSGTRRDVRSIRWGTQDSTLVLTDSTGFASSKVFHVQGDTLRLLSYYFNGSIDTITFVREEQPSLAPSAGEHSAALVGNWSGSSRRITYTVDSDGDWVPDDTSWIPDEYLLRADGTGMNVGYDNDYRCDTLPLSTPVTTEGSWDSVETPSGCDPVHDGGCSYTALRHCHEAYVPEDTTGFTWWTHQSRLYLGIWAPGSTSRTIVATQVVGWSATGDSLKIQSYYDSGLVQGYRRAP